jgi:hypothetical protein
MSTPYFRTDERVSRLVNRANLLLGTPWRPNSCEAGVGMSCHNLPRDLYIENGHLSQNFPLLESTPATATALNEMEVFLNGRPEFERIALCGLCAGDLLGMCIPISSVGKRLRHRSVNHLGVLLPKSWFVHVLMKKNTDKDLLNVPPWSQILIAAWRPLET